MSTTKLVGLKFRTVQGALQRLGCIPKPNSNSVGRGTGQVWCLPGPGIGQERYTTLNATKSGEVPRGVIQRILRDLDINREEFIAALNK